MSRIAAPFLAIIILVSVSATAGLASETQWRVRLNLYYGAVGGSPMDWVTMGAPPPTGECMIPEGCCPEPDPLPPYVHLYWFRTTWGTGNEKQNCDYRSPLSPGQTKTWEDLRAEASQTGTLYLNWLFLPAPYAVPSAYELTIYDEGTTPNPTGGTRYVMQGPGAVASLERSNSVGVTHYFHVVVTSPASPPPTCTITHAPFVAQPGQTVTFDSHAQASAPAVVASVAWNFGDGTSGTGVTTTHTYTTLGPKNVTATVTDDQGLTGTCTAVVTVAFCELPICSITFSPASPTAGQPLAFQLAGATEEATVNWSFGDGSSATGVTASHTYTAPGSYTVSAIAEIIGPCGPALATCSTPVTVLPNSPPTCSITYTPSSPQFGQTVSFDSHAQATPPATVASVAWSFGDGATGAGITTTHTWASMGSRTVAAIVTDSLGATGTCTVTQTCCALSPPTVSITSPTDGATVSGSLNTTATASDPAGVVTQVEFFVDGMSLGVDTTAPYVAPPLDTTAYSDGPHAIAAKATNNAGLSTWSHVVVRFSNTPPPTRPTFAFSCTRVSYSGGVLVVRFRVTNASAISTAQAVSINSFTLIGTTVARAQEALATTPVSASFPKNLGDLAPGVSQTFNLQATIPADVTKVSRYMFVGQFTFGGNTYYF